MSSVEPVVEHRESMPSRWLRERRFRVALPDAVVERRLRLLCYHGWWYVLGAAIVAVALYFFGRRMSSPGVHEVTWILATSQVISVLVPVLWVIVRTLAIIVLVLLGLFFLAILLLDRPRRYTRSA